jgi:hypothetical protein
MAAVVFDSSFLIKLLDPKIKGEGQVDARLAYLIETLDKRRDKVVVPTPALSEVLIGAGDAAPAYLDILSKTTLQDCTVWLARGGGSRSSSPRSNSSRGQERRFGQLGKGKV